MGVAQPRDFRRLFHHCTRLASSSVGLDQFHHCKYDRLAARTVTRCRIHDDENSV